MMAFAGNFQSMNFIDPKTIALANILFKKHDLTLSKLLVVGCGKGSEAAVLAQCFKGVSVTGIDIVPNFDPRCFALADLRQGDATQMEFDDESFDFVYSFHALEHIPEYRVALSEVQRVLRPGGGWMIGTPNRDRVVGYLGSNNASISNKLYWNFLDWKAKLRGRFRNEDGAHAGFTKEELNEELVQVFGEVNDITLDYYLNVYAHKRGLIEVMAHTGIARWLFPALYFYGRR